MIQLPRADRVRLLLLVLGAFVALMVASLSVPARAELRLAEAGTERVHFTYRGKALLSFGGGSDFIFYVGRDAYDWLRWADWSQAHGMNHLRAYPPLSWQMVESVTLADGGDRADVLFPYQETDPGSRQFDLTRFNPAYWARFRQQLSDLQDRGIIVHLLMVNGWQAKQTADNWSGHFFNPANNVNPETDVLAGERGPLGLYDGRSNAHEGLRALQKAWLEKLVRETAGFDNVYFDLVHEIADHFETWAPAQDWIDEMAQTVGHAWERQTPGRPLILGMDTGGLTAEQRQWIFARPYFDLLIYGKGHSPDRALAWRRQYKKPYVAQESYDENNQKYSWVYPDQRHSLRKYVWRLVMAKTQQIDVYAKRLGYGDLRLAPGVETNPLNYDPRGINGFEADAAILRALFDKLQDYPSLRPRGLVYGSTWSEQVTDTYRRVKSFVRTVGNPVPWELTMTSAVLSSETEALIHMASAPDRNRLPFAAREIRISDLALADGDYLADLIDPSAGPIKQLPIEVRRGRTEFQLPAFVDDIAIHVTAKPASPQTASAHSPNR
ncbi:MAG: hypothetical protein ACFB6S_08205 [Geminicoccaceae bacterium]